MKRVCISLAAGALGCLIGLHFVSVAAAGEETVLHSFGAPGDTALPNTALLDLNGVFYGTANETLYSLDPQSGAESVVYTFCSQPDCTDGQDPEGGLTALNGLLYGTTYYGGAGTCTYIGCGTVFSLDPTTGAEKAIYAFTSDTDASFPASGVIVVNGMLYGTSTNGGSGGCDPTGCGAVFEVDPVTGAESVLYSFKDGADGGYPVAGLISVNGILYGTTSTGGASCSNEKQGCGTVFSIDPSTGIETVVYAFAGGSDGGYPYANLIDVNGVLYGTTVVGGANGNGTLFSLDLSGRETPLYSFCSQANCADGYKSGPLVNVNGILYGETVGGGPNPCPHHRGYCGTAYAFNPATNAFTVLYDFCAKGGKCKDGGNPEGGLIYLNKNLYGTATTGGIYSKDDGGVAFSLKLPK